MASIDWPSSIPIPTPVGGKPESGALRTQMDVGPAKVRRRTTATARPMQFTMQIPGDKFETFKTFYHTTTLEGSLAFNMDDPQDDVEYEWRFLTEETYDWNIVSGASNPNDRIVDVTVYMERLP
ncbi:MAG: hypothetical protein CL666_08590 [Balneola sp.]|nr:hypothetical protein [Balneola sp.]|tara:strand:+ start:27384 stop:27755 length:372 start_codon:yes stop_codon:yes gene_type:complete